MNRLLLAGAVAVSLPSMLGAQDRQSGTLPPDPRNGPVEVIHALFVKAQMIDNGQVMFIFPRGEEVPSLIAKVDGKKVRAVGTDLKPLGAAELKKRLPVYTIVVAVQAEYELPDPHFLKVLNDRSVVFVLPKEMFAPMAKASGERPPAGPPGRIRP
jgi:hypothetical protein